MVKLLKNNWRVLLVLCLLACAAAARLWKIEYTPYPDDGDELAYVFAGQSLIEFGRPISWSSFLREPVSFRNISIGEDTVSRPAKFSLVNPWFDHNFVLPLIVGSWSELGGYTFPSIPPAVWYRLPMVLFAVITLALAFAISNKWWGYWGGILTLVLIGFSPSFVFIQRMVVPENLIVPAFLAAVYAFITKRPWWQVAIFAIMAGLVKVTGLLILPILAIGYWLRKERTEALAYVGVTLVAVALFSLLYAASVDIGLYLNAIKNQSSRLIGWGNPAFLLSSPGFHNYVFLDFSYYVMLLLGIGGVAKAFVTQEEAKDDEEKIRGVIVLSMVLGWFCTVWVTSAELDMLGWYKIPLFICLSIAAGALASKKYLIPLSIFAAITFFNNFGLIKYPDKQLPEAQVLRFWVALILVGAVGTTAFFRKQLKPALAILSVLVVALMAQSLWVSDQFFAANCKDRTCSTPIVTLKSFVKDILKK